MTNTWTAVFAGEVTVRANPIAAQPSDASPDRAIPHGIQLRNLLADLPLSPRRVRRLTPCVWDTLGIAVNGVVFERQAAKRYGGQHNAEPDPPFGAVGGQGTLNAIWYDSVAVAASVMWMEGRFAPGLLAI